jgi:hypothetical protein
VGGLLLHATFGYVKTHYQLVRADVSLSLLRLRLDSAARLSALEAVSSIRHAGAAVPWPLLVCLYHIAAFVVCCSASPSSFSSDMSFYLNHFYLVAVLGFAYAFVPANKLLGARRAARHLAPAVADRAVLDRRDDPHSRLGRLRLRRLRQDERGLDSRRAAGATGCRAARCCMPRLAPILDAATGTPLIMSWSGSAHRHAAAVSSFIRAAPALARASSSSFAFHVHQQDRLQHRHFPDG